MASSIFGNVQSGNVVVDMVSKINQLGGPQRAVASMLGNGQNIPTPNGGVTSVFQLAEMMKTQTPQQVCQSLGIDYAQYQQVQNTLHGQF